MDYINTPISEMGRVVTGKTPSTAVSEYYDGDIMFITPSELHTDFMVEKSEKTITTAGFNSIKNNTIRGTSVMVGCIGWDMGNVAVCSETCATNQQINSITDIKPEYNPLYIYYWLKTKKDYLFSMASVTRTPILSKSTFEEILVPMPPKNKQDAITHILSAVDKKIMSNNAVNDNLAQQVNALYDYWFTQFDFPDENNKPYRLSGGQMVWNDKLKMNIPISFNSIPLRELLSFQSGYSFSSDEYVANGKYSLITIKNVQDDGINLHIDNYIQDIPEKMPHYCLLKQKDILMSLTGNTGRVGLMFTNNCLLNQRVAVVVLNKQVLHAYTYCLLKNNLVRKKLEAIAGGSSQANLSPIDAANIQIAFNEKMAIAFSKKIQPAIDIIVNNLRENLYLHQIRDFLLPLLMNGQANIAE